MGFFKKSTRPSQAELVKKVHEDFYTEVDKLLEACNITKTDKQAELMEKANKLKYLGFTSTKEVSEAQKLSERLELSDKIKRAIEYFSMKYPQYKFITEDSVKKICEKWGLLYGNVSRYKGDVPNKNLQQMMEFKIHEKDECWEELTTYGIIRNATRFVSYGTAIKERELHQENLLSGYRRSSFGERKCFNKCAIEIAALPKDFNMEKHRVVNSKIVLKEDPIVLAPVYFEGTKHYLVVTAWGPEAADVVNEKMN